jgi:hypothetical protein
MNWMARAHEVDDLNEALRNEALLIKAVFALNRWMKE